MPRDEAPSGRAPPAFEVELPADVRCLRHFRNMLSTWLEGLDLNESTRIDLVLATHEAAANAIEHGGSPSDIHVHAFADHDTVDITIRDNGRWKQPHRPRPGDRGRGLSMIRALVSDLQIEQSDNGTTLRISQNL